VVGIPVQKSTKGTEKAEREKQAVDRRKCSVAVKSDYKVVDAAKEFAQLEVVNKAGAQKMSSESRNTSAN